MSQRETSKKTTNTTTVIMVTMVTMANMATVDTTTNQRKKVCQHPLPSNLPSFTLFCLLNSGSWAPSVMPSRKLSNLLQRNNHQQLSNKFQLLSQHQLLKSEKSDL